MRRLGLTLTVVMVGLAGCTSQSDSGFAEVPDDVTLGPVDGRDLPPTDLDRIRVGDPAPDFSLASLGGSIVTLSDFRGDKNVILVFYRGYW